MARQLILFVLALTPVSAAAQARLHGTVPDSAGGAPLALVEVVVGGGRVAARTDALGRYAIDLPLGVHAISFRRVGYRQVDRQGRLASMDLTRLDVAMHSEAVQLAPVEVEAPAPPRNWPPGLDARITEGFGDFITNSVMRKFEHSSMSNLLQSRVSGVRFKRISGCNVARARRSCWGERVRAGVLLSDLSRRDAGLGSWRLPARSQRPLRLCG